jgi:hypothetical protein
MIPVHLALNKIARVDHYPVRFICFTHCALLSAQVAAGSSSRNRNEIYAVKMGILALSRLEATACGVVALLDDSGNRGLSNWHTVHPYAKKRSGEAAF